MSCFKEIAVIERKSLSNNAQYFKSLFKIGEFYPISHKKMVDIEDDFERQFQEQELERNNIQHAKIIKQQLKQSNEKQERKQKNKISKLSSTLKPDLDSYTNKIIDIVLACVEEGDIDIAMTREQKDRIKRIHKQINNQDQKQDQKSNENDFNEEDLRKCPFCKSKNIIEGGNEFDFDLIIPIAYFFYSCEDCKKEWVVKLIPTKSIKQ